MMTGLIEKDGAIDTMRDAIASMYLGTYTVCSIFRDIPLHFQLQLVLIR